MIEIRRMASDEEIGTAHFISRRFLASPIFAGIDEVRYQPERIIESMRRGRTFVALAKVLVGSITLFPPDPTSACETLRDHPSFGLLAVDASLGGRGIGRALIEFAESDSGGRIALSVTSRGQELIAFYERLGYRRVGTFQWPGAIDESCIMSKQLSQAN